MRAGRTVTSCWIAGLIAGVLCASCFGAADTPTAKSHRKAAKKPQLPTLPSGPQGPVPQISLDIMQAVAPHVTFQDGQLTIVAPNSTLGDILRAVRKLTGAEMEIPANATERVVTNLGPGPAPFVVAALLNGSHFNYVLLGAPSDANTLTRVVLVAKSGPDTTPAPPAQTPLANAVSPPQPIVAETAPETADADAADDAEDNADQNAAETEQQPAPGTPADTAVKTPQQLLQEMQQRQMQMQQGQGLPGQGQPGQPPGQPPIPGGVIPPPQRPPDQQ